MKTLIIPLLLVALGIAHADTWELENRIGGKIVATDRPCPRKSGEGLLYVYSYISSGETLQGCWTAMDRNIVIMWDNGQMTVHAVEAFMPVETGKPHVEPTPTLPKSNTTKA